MADRVRAGRRRKAAEYFAWWSDHDRWHPEWLATLVETLDRQPEVVLAYPLTQRMDPAGLPLEKPARQFETFGITDVATRWKMLSRSDSVAAGDIVYGLMRVEAMKQAGIFREVLCPDRLLIAEMTLQGQIRQVPEVLWSRRQFSAGSVARQRATLFRPGTKVPSALTAPWYMHARSLWARYGRHTPGTPWPFAPGCGTPHCLLRFGIRLAPLREVQRAAGAAEPRSAGREWVYKRAQAR